MKTDKFEKTIRQKLESISPDFHESDWTKMQNYMHVHTPPTLWKQYGSWLGYAAAASVTTAMAFMYVNQLSQNNKLSSDVKILQNQISVIRANPLPKAKVDTVYILQKKGQFVSDGLASRSNSNDSDLAQTEPETEITPENIVGSQLAEDRSGNINNVIKSQQNTYQSKVLDHKLAQETTELNLQPDQPKDVAVPRNNERQIKPDQNLKDAISSIPSNSTSASSKPDATVEKAAIERMVSTKIDQSNIGVTMSSGAVQNALVNSKTLGSKFDEIVSQTPKSFDYASNKMNGMLMNRLSSKQMRKNWLVSTANNYKNIDSDKKTQQTTQAENVIPKLNLKVPYRFGGGLEFQKGIQIKTIVGEVLVAKKFSISAGLSWLKIKPMEFFTEKMFREKNKEDFKQSHPNEVPKAFVVTNIRVEPTLVQIPLTFAYRNDLKDNFAYFVGAGANVTVKSREKISYTCLVPNPRQEFLSQSFERKMDISPINSVNLSLGVEKTWHPIVVQAEGYMYSYFKPLNRLTPRSGPGFKVKLLYQIGNKR